ncbi:MAG: hypothetical protein ACRDFB_06355 [Rhabdochlamydiaceae bacterium]
MDMPDFPDEETKPDIPIESVETDEPLVPSFEPLEVPQESVESEISGIPVDEGGFAYTPPELPDYPQESQPPKRRRGRPPKFKSDVQLPPSISERKSALKTRSDSQLSQRGQAILIGVTALPAHFAPPVRMTEAEAQAICDPLVSYAKSHADIKAVEEFVERWDLIAAGLGLANYSVRVTKDLGEERKRRVRSVPRPSVVNTSGSIPNASQSEQRPESNGVPSNSQSRQDDAPFISTPFVGEL